MNSEHRNTTRTATQPGTFGIKEEVQIPVLALGFMTILYNAYAISNNIFFAMDDSEVWVHMGFSAFIILAMVVLCQDIIKSRWPGTSDMLIIGGIGMACIATCIICYFTGNHTGKEIRQYYNSYFVKTYNERSKLYYGLLAEIKGGNLDRLEQYLKTEVKPRLQGLVTESGTVKVPGVLKATHEAYMRHFNTFVSISDTFLKSIEARDVSILVPIMDSLSKNHQDFESITDQVREIGKNHDLTFE